MNASRRAMDFTPGTVSNELFTSRTAQPVAAASTAFATEIPPANTTRTPAVAISDANSQSAR